MAFRATTLTYLAGMSTTPARDNSIHRVERPADDRMPNDPALGECLRNLEIKFQWKRTLRRLRELPTGWDSYDAPPPNDVSLAVADKFLDLLSNERLFPASIIASAEGGIGICFGASDRYADLEFLNSGEIIGVRYRGTTLPIVWETDSSEGALIKSIKGIREYLEA
jgi:hypothetical protein